MGSLEVIPYWHYNVPDKEKTAECPAFLLNLNDKDRRVVGSPDAAYTLRTWPEVCNIIASNRLDVFQRVPSQLRRYKAYSHRLARQYGSVADFVVRERLRWPEPIRARGEPFQYADDVKITHNDWPYGLDARIVHLVVWTKFELKADPATGDLTERARAEIDAFMSTTFRSRIPPSQVMWFKNWSALKSIHAVEHFHVMMLDPDPEFIREITNGDIPQCDKADP
ncbi:N-acetylglucosamine-induced protein 1 [Tolypocladium ophioglossoides CBS 100239]|uniref:N-acetylglucosamine-induced protein 1 n=1 Tax=Tolypocladium ophioglossoides (strain CBS 100239) TaxID=1163406 RepID=A0A0L0NL48_TOLOC|nr:N-acetylglucosamine-induced protein 1 [Tolypocladium ophioglossoides CBS 100239]